MGCQQSVPVPGATKPVTGVGQTERMVSRAQRLNPPPGGGNSSSEQHGSSIIGGKKKNADSSRDSHASKELPKLDAKGHLMPEEVFERTSNSIRSKVAYFGTANTPIKVEYAYWTQRGYYPEDPHKENQDEVNVSLKFAGEERGAMLAVYDGHGKQGHACARYCKEKLPKYVAKYVRQARVKKYQAQLKRRGKKVSKTYDPVNWPLLSKDEYGECCKKGFLECNKEMHSNLEGTDKLSGTTAITACFHGNLVTICNVGDSRAVLGYCSCKKPGNSEEEKEEVGEHDHSDGVLRPEVAVDDDAALGGALGGNRRKLLAIPLSRDQTPYRRDERERVKKRGAAIMSIDQMEGKEDMHENWGDIVLGKQVDVHSDPPRVWIEGKDYPGTAFTRSLGDSLAEDIGVTAEPEILSIEQLTTNDHILVIASDGIFEFLTNQEVVDICQTCPNPMMACETLVSAAYEQWLHYERRTDDITVIICFLSCDHPPPTDGSKLQGTTEDLVSLASSNYGSKPVRKKRGISMDGLIECATLEVDMNGKKRNYQGGSLYKDGGYDAVDPVVSSNADGDPHGEAEDSA